MKKILSIFLTVCICFSVMPAAAMNMFESGITEIPEDWTVTASPSGKADVSIDENGDLLLEFDTTDSAAKGNTRVITGYYDAKYGQLNISFTISPVLTEKVEGVIRVMDSNTQTMFSLMELEGSAGGTVSASFFGGEYVSEITGETKIRFVIDSSNSFGALFIGDSEEPEFSGVLSSWKSEIDLSSLRFLVQMNASSKIQASASMKISDFSAEGFEGEYNLTSSPENGAEFVDVTMSDSICVDFGCPVLDSSKKKENFTLYEAETAMDFNIESHSDGVIIKPLDGFKENTSYKLVAAAVRDLYGSIKAENAEISFKTAVEGYVTPKVSVKAAKNEITAGDITVIDFEITEGEVIKTEIYLNGEYVTEFTENSFSYNFSAKDAGEYQIYAKAYDKSGGCGISDTVNITVNENAFPEIMVSGIEDGAVYTAGSTPVARAEAVDSDGIAAMSVYVDGRRVKQTSSTSISYDIAEISAGTHTVSFEAVDVFGFYENVSFSLTIESNLLIDYSFEDFSDYTGDNAVPKNCQGGPQRGYLDAAVIDAEHGNSLIIGMDTVNNQYTVGNQAYVGFPLNSTANKFSIEMEVYVDTPPASGDPYQFLLRSSAKAVALAQIQSSQIWSNTNGSATYDAAKWINIKFVFDALKKRVELYVDGEKIGGYVELPSDVGTLNYLRLFGTNYDEVKTFVAVDNVKVTTICETPTVNMTKTVYEFDTDSISFALDGDMDYTSLTLDKITLESEFGKVKLDSVSMSGDVVTLKLGEKLESSMSYKLTISEQVRFSTGAEIGAKSSAEFKTTADVLDVISGEYVSEGGMLKFNFKVQNLTGKEALAYVLIQRVKSGRIAETSVKRVAVSESAGLQSFSVANAFPVKGEELKIFILEGLKVPKSLSRYSYSYK